MELLLLAAWAGLAPRHSTAGVGAACRWSDHKSSTGGRRRTCRRRVAAPGFASASGNVTRCARCESLRNKRLARKPFRVGQEDGDEGSFCPAYMPRSAKPWPPLNRFRNLTCSLSSSLPGFILPPSSFILSMIWCGARNGSTPFFCTPMHANAHHFAFVPINALHRTFPAHQPCTSNAQQSGS